MGEIRHQHVQASLAAAISPLAISPSTLINNNTMSKDQTTTPGTPRPTLFDKCVGILCPLLAYYSEDAGDGAYGLSSLSEKT